MRVADSARTTLSVGGATAKEMAIAVLSHPSRPSQVGFPCPPGSDWFAGGVDIQHELCDFLPVGTIFLGIEQTKVRDQMLLIVAREDPLVGRGIGNWRVERRRLHVALHPAGGTGLI